MLSLSVGSHVLSIALQLSWTCIYFVVAPYSQGTTENMRLSSSNVTCIDVQALLLFPDQLSVQNKQTSDTDLFALACI